MKRMCMLLALTALAGCAAPVRPPPADGTEARPADGLIRLEPGSARVYEIDREASEIRIVVFPDGPMARLGHPHVIGGPVVSGRVALADPFADSFVELEIDVAALEVDHPAWRAAEGFDPELEKDAIEGTRDNLLGPKVLAADAHPRIRLQAFTPTGPQWHPDFTVRLALRGEVREITVPVSLGLEGERLKATGRFLIRTSEFGLEPFSTAGGALRVADEILLRFRIEARTDTLAP